MSIFFIRHGQSEFNAIWDGKTDPMIFDARLTALGREQAIATRAQAAELGLEHIACSPLTRAIETTLLMFPESQPAILPNARELLDHACDIGRSPTDLKQEFTQLNFDGLEETWWHQGPPNSVGVPVEPREVFLERIKALLDEIELISSRPIGIVCHGNLIEAVTGAPHPRNCEIVPYTPL